mmetsp:Transcript_30002/g.36571  ORF Transcript_30002/g.36571 Transcript_30002/m.36571 type:complete len:236 (+) Transcript_30002:412-1119(+)
MARHIHLYQMNVNIHRSSSDTSIEQIYIGNHPIGRRQFRIKKLTPPHERHTHRHHQPSSLSRSVVHVIDQTSRTLIPWREHVLKRRIVPATHAKLTTGVHVRLVAPSKIRHDAFGTQKQHAFRPRGTEPTNIVPNGTSVVREGAFHENVVADEFAVPADERHEGDDVFADEPDAGAFAVLSFGGRGGGGGGCLGEVSAEHAHHPVDAGAVIGEEEGVLGFGFEEEVDVVAVYFGA